MFLLNTDKNYAGGGMKIQMGQSKACPSLYFKKPTVKQSTAK